MSGFRNKLEIGTKHEKDGFYYLNRDRPWERILYSVHTKDQAYFDSFWALSLVASHKEQAHWRIRFNGTTLQIYHSHTKYRSFDEPFEEVVYPKGEFDAVSICKNDFDLLKPDIFVNDTIIDFYITHLKMEMRPEDRQRFHFFNSFFFKKLVDLDKDPPSAFEARASFQRVRRWTGKVNLFEKDYVFIPVNYKYHWSLIVICHPGEVCKYQDEDMEKTLKVPCILHMDSIKGNHFGLEDFVESYLWEEWKERQKEASEHISSKFFNLRFVPLELPQQENAFDCGLFLLHYVERFLVEAPLNFSPFRISNFSNFLNVDWFPPAEPSLKRVRIQKLIHEIIKRENSPPDCSGKPCASYPKTTNEIETSVGFISAASCSVKCSVGNSSSSQADQGIDINLLTTSFRSSECASDSGLDLRESFEAETIAGSFIGGQHPTSDQTASFSQFNSAVSQMEEDVEAGGQFACSSSNRTGFQRFSTIEAEGFVLPYSSRDFEVDTALKLGISVDHARNKNIEESLEAQIHHAPAADSLEVNINENNVVHEDLTIEILDDADTHYSDHMLDANGRKSLPDLSRQHRNMQEKVIITLADRKKLLQRKINENNVVHEDLTIDILDDADTHYSDHMLDANGRKSLPDLSHQHRDMQEKVNITLADRKKFLHRKINENKVVNEDVIIEILDDADTHYSNHMLDANGRKSLPDPSRQHRDMQEKVNITLADRKKFLHRKINENKVVHEDLIIEILDDADIHYSNHMLNANGRKSLSDLSHQHHDMQEKVNITLVDRKKFLCRKINENNVVHEDLVIEILDDADTHYSNHMFDANGRKSLPDLPHQHCGMQEVNITLANRKKFLQRKINENNVVHEDLTIEILDDVDTYYSDHMFDANGSCRDLVVESDLQVAAERVVDGSVLDLNELLPAKRQRRFRPL